MNSWPCHLKRGDSQRLRWKYFCTFWGLEEENWRLGWRKKGGWRVVVEGGCLVLWLPPSSMASLPPQPLPFFLLTSIFFIGYFFYRPLFLLANFIVTPAIQYGFPPPLNPYLYKYLDNMLHYCCISFKCDQQSLYLSLKLVITFGLYTW